MNFLSWFILFIFTIGAVSYFRLKLLNATIAIGIALIIGDITGHVNLLGWVVFLIPAIVLNNPNIRQNFISKKLLKLFRQVMPEMSSTEKAAIDAGTVWWDGQIFSGKPDWDKLHRIPQAQLTPEEQAFLDGPVEEVCKMVDDWQINHELADLPPEIWQYLKDNKFFAMIIKKEYGGLEFSAFAQSRVLQKLSGVNIVLTTTVGVPNSLGPGELLQHYGTQAQKDQYLPGLANGTEIPCFALTSPEAGSDAGAIPDTGVVCKGEWEGKETLGIMLNFDKRYITLAPVSTVVGLAFKMYDPDGLLGDKKDIGITCALIPANTPGLDIGRRHFPINIPFQNGPVRAKDLFVPLDFIIGGPKMAGEGWRMLVECLSVGRVITLPSNSAGGAKSVALATGAYARIRRQFKLPIGKMEGIEEMLGRIGGSAYMMDAVTRLSTKAVDMGEKPSVISAVCKYHLTEMGRQAVTDSMDVHGGKGIMLGPNNYLARGYQGAPIAITVEGANILTRNMMIYGQGAMRSHPYVLKLIQTGDIKDKEEELLQFDSLLFSHMGFAMSNFFRAIWFSLTFARFAGAPFNDSTAKYYRALTRISTNMALLSDIAMGLLGGALKRKERTSARLGDMLSYQYLATAALKRFDEDGRHKEDTPLLDWSVQYCLAKAEAAQRDLLENFPNPVVGAILKVLLMPFGTTYKAPSDKLDHKVSLILQTPGAARNRLGHGQYLSREPNNLMGDLEQTLEDIIACEPIFDRIVKAAGEKLSFTQLDKAAEKGLALGVINEQEASLLRNTEQGRLRTINVDDFDPAALPAGKPKIRAKK